MNYPAAELRGINVIPVKTGIQIANRLDSRFDPSKFYGERAKDCGNDRKQSRLLTPMQSIEEFF